ncbi:MAG: hypothetical protein F4X65_06450 [Chloroflexi bacterium]|nr:hypothetical protein [Chloroflexota bacterium]
MKSLVINLVNHGKRSTGPIVAQRILMAAVVVLALGVVGSALFEYRLLQAAAHLPAVRYEGVLSTECPGNVATEATEATQATGLTEFTGAEAAFAPKGKMTWGLSSLAGFRCTIPLTPD